MRTGCGSIPGKTEVISGCALLQWVRRRCRRLSCETPIFRSANNYEVPKTAPQLAAKLQFRAGTDEWGSRFRDLKWATGYLPQIEIVEIPHMMHGEYVMMHPGEFTKKAMEFLQ